jgi:outer membrane receptor protein involved in Fe transport
MRCKITRFSGKRALLGSAAILAGLALGGEAARADLADATDRIDTITVTAQRRAENAQNVPIALTVLNSNKLVDNGVDTVNDLQYLVPSFQATPQFGSGQPSFRIRGVGFEDYASNNSPTVGIYVDEFAFPIPFVTQGTQFDINHVEVLRGPQGTLYGLNTTGGAVNFSLNKPTDFFTGGGRLTFGRYLDTRFDTALSGPLSDKVQIRIAGTTEQGGAWQYNRTTNQSLGNKDKGALRIITDYEAGIDLKVELTVHGLADRSDQQGLYLITPLKTASGVIIPADTNHTATGWGTSPSFAAEIGIAPDQKPLRDNNGWGADLRADWTLPFALVSDLASYEAFDRREYDAFDASNAADADVFFDSRAAVYTDELRVRSKDGDSLAWTGGVYLSYQHLNEVYRSGFINSFGVNANTPYSQTAKTGSVYAQISPHLTDRIGADLGLRVEHEDRNLYDFNTFGLTASGAILNFTALDQHRSIAYTLPSGVARLNYRATDAALVYGSVSRGVKSGGFTAYNTTDATGIGTQPFQPEKLWAFEVGSKSSFAQDRLQLNNAAFYYDYTDQQVQSSIVDPVYGQIGKIVNAPKSTIVGAESELTWKPIAALTLGQSVGYTRGHYDRFLDVGGAAQDPTTGRFSAIQVDRKGQSIEAPKLTYGGSAAYGWTVPGFLAELGADYSYRSQYLSHFGALYNVAPYWLANARLTVRPQQGPWSLSLWGRNIFNANYDITRNFFVTGANIGVAGEPATYGFTADVTF